MQIPEQLLEGRFAIRRPIQHEQQPLRRRGFVHHPDVVSRLRQWVHGTVQRDEPRGVDRLGHKPSRQQLSGRRNRKESSEKKAETWWLHVELWPPCGITFQEFGSNDC